MLSQLLHSKYNTVLKSHHSFKSCHPRANSTPIYRRLVGHERHFSLWEPACLPKEPKVFKDSQKKPNFLKAYMGGLVMMVILTKNWEFLLYYISTMWITQTHYFFLIDFILTYRSRRVIICKNITKKSAHQLGNKIQTFLKFLLIILKISYFQN